MLNIRIKVVPRTSRPLDREVFIFRKDDIMLDKKYNHEQVENGKYDYWMKKGYFKSGDETKNIR